MLRNILIFVLFFLYILSPTFELVSIPASVIIFFIVGLFYLLQNDSLTFSIKIIYALIFFSFMGVYSGLIQLTLSDLNVFNGNLIFLKIMINNAMYLLFGVMVVRLLMRDDDLSFFLKVIVVVVFVNSILILLASLFPEVKHSLESILSQEYDSNLDYVNGFRARGLAAAGGFSLSALSIMAGVICVFLCANKKISSVYAFIALTVITVSQVFIARTGLYVCIIVFIAWYLYSIFFDNNRFFLIIVAVIVIFSLIAVFEMYGERINATLTWAFELFNNISSGSGVHTNSTDDLLTMFNVPSDLIRLIFGFGFYEADVDYRSDSGFVRSLYSVGVLSIFIYIFHCYMLCKKMPACHHLYKNMFIILFLILMVLEIKGPVFYQNYTARLLFVFYAFALVNQNKILK